MRRLKLRKAGMKKNNLSVNIFLYDHTGIVTSKPECVAQCDIYGSFLRLIECKIQSRIEFGIICKMVDGGGNLIFYHTHDAGDRFNGTGGTKTMSRHGFGGTDVNVKRMLPKYINNGFNFCNIP